jgi:hypothetical protein
MDINNFIGIPINENEWLKYEGHCIIFAGKIKCNKKNKWIMESDDITKNKLILGLLNVGIKCNDVEIEWSDKVDGTKKCKCICYYNKPYEIYNSEFFIDGITQSSYCPSCPLEFYFEKRID